MDEGLLIACWRLSARYPFSGTALQRLLQNHAGDVLAVLQDPDCAGAADEEDQDLELALQWRSEQRHLLALTHPQYPKSLKQLADPPILLYVLGSIEALHRPQIAMVGSRQPSAGGRDNAQAFASELAAQGWAITSGMALGIDGAAHRGALQVGGQTIAVTGTGIDRVYPAAHRELAHQIAASGALVSELPLGAQALKMHFPRRNRLIAALSQGTLVVEAALSSGSLITAQQALELGREVFAIPGSIHNPLSRGCHALIRQGAKLVETAQDIIDELGCPHVVEAPVSKFVAGEFQPDADHERLLHVMGYDPVPQDLLIERSGLGAGVVAGMLLTLELNGWVELAAGGYLRRR